MQLARAGKALLLLGTNDHAFGKRAPLEETCEAGSAECSICQARIVQNTGLEVFSPIPLLVRPPPPAQLHSSRACPVCLPYTRKSHLTPYVSRTQWAGRANGRVLPRTGDCDVH